MKARHKARCHICKQEIEVGQEIVLVNRVRQKGKKPKTAQHRLCHLSAASERELRSTWTTGTLWRTKGPASPVTTRIDPSITRRAA